MSTDSTGDSDRPECAYFATPEELEAARELARQDCRLEADDETEESKDK